MRSGVPRLVYHVREPVAVAQTGRDWQTVDGLVPHRRGQTPAGDTGDGLDGDRQTAAGMDDRQAEPAQGALAAGVFVERRDCVAQQQRGAALVGRARPELCDRNERLGPARCTVTAI